MHCGDRGGGAGASPQPRRWRFSRRASTARVPYSESDERRAMNTAIFGWKGVSHRHGEGIGLWSRMTMLQTAVHEVGYV